MPLVMDLHNLGNGLSIDEIANAHQADLATRGEYHVSYLGHWSMSARGRSSAWWSLMPGPRPRSTQGPWPGGRRRLSGARRCLTRHRS
jgi:hypothetical protein